MKRIVSFVIIICCAACNTGTYYQANLSFNQEFETGDLEGALNTLQAKTSEASGRREFLFDVNNGLVLSMLGRYDQSNDYFEKAYLFGEDYRTNYLYEVTSYLTNPNFATYRGEDHEHLMLLYYKALNYVKQNNFEDALVECRRLNIRLQQLSDRYGSDNKYREDAFIHLMMGVIFEAGKDYNNAFVAYRNSYNVYKNSFENLFRLDAPPQLKLDLLRTAWLSGLIDEFNQYKEEFDMPDYKYEINNQPELVFFWHNGLSPVKVEWGINFIVNRRDNFLYFSNNDMQMVFPFNLGNYNEHDRNGLASLEVFRVAFPRYVERPVFFHSAELALNGDNNRIKLQKAEDINAIAFKCLQERMNHELSKALIRLALKKVTEMEVKKADRTFGSVVGMINALTEHADTRNWQTLPHEISYCRVPLNIGKNKVTLHVATQGAPDTSYDFEYEAKEGQTLFHTFTSLESHYPTY